MDRLNYHHLRYFREVALDGQLGRTAARLNVSQSALSMQIKALEESLGAALFERVSRRLVLTDAGRVALAHADRIFSAGNQLLQAFKSEDAMAPPLRVGAASTLSRNFQLQFLRPLFAQGQVVLSLKSGSTPALLEELKTFGLDVVLSTDVPGIEEGATFAARKIAEQTVSLHGQKDRIAYGSLGELLRHEPVILPTDNTIRTGFNALISQLDVTPRIAASVDDMAMVRLLARDGVGLAVAPSVVLADELQSGVLATAPFDLGISEAFFAVTLAQQVAHPGLTALLEHGERQ